MFLDKLFSSKEKLKVINSLFYENYFEIGIRSIARKTNTAPSLVFNTVNLLEKEKILKDNKVDCLNPRVKAIKILLNIQKINNVGLIQEIRKLFKDCKGIGLYGSWANGTNMVDSDLDLWINAEEDENKTAVIRRLVKQKLKTDLSLIFFNEKKLANLRSKDIVFFSALHNSFILWGEGI